MNLSFTNKALSRNNLYISLAALRLFLSPAIWPKQERLAGKAY
jgi:hypothetical protein